MLKGKVQQLNSLRGLSIATEEAGYKGNWSTQRTFHNRPFKNIEYCISVFHGSRDVQEYWLMYLNVPARI
jgi:hypothetical protein